MTSTHLDPTLDPLTRTVLTCAAIVTTPNGRLRTVSAYRLPATAHRHRLQPTSHVHHIVYFYEPS